MVFAGTIQRSANHTGTSTTTLQWLLKRSDAIDLVLRSYFSMIGWETSDEKDGGFSSAAKALGVEVCLDEIHLGSLKVQNTEYKGSGSSLQPSSLSWRMVVREGV